VKLVRDRIPELAAANGQPDLPACDRGRLCHLAAGQAPGEAQEAATASPAGLVEELGDVLQILYALAELAGLEPAAIECARARKAHTHGTYTRRILRHPPT
jgi:predicted house-cleaning noncanonical NTP pyrophosphatase (MazG superfamily)